MVDLSCDIWQKVCGETGYCMIYDLDHMMEQVTIVTGSLVGRSEPWVIWETLLHKQERQRDPGGQRPTPAIF